MAMIGRGAAIAEVGAHRHELHGVIAFSAWLGVHAALMTGVRNRIDAFVNWGWDYFSHARGPQVLDRSDAARIDWDEDAAPEPVSAAVVTPIAVTTVDLARVQFAMTSIYHFLFVPLTLGLAPLVAIMQTTWYRTGVDAWLRLTRFFGTLLLINFAIGVATGLVQEFQFGMNWSVYSKFVGGVFGAPLAIEGLAAFFLEATFLGLWIFGWDRLSPRLHLATIWLAALGTWLSAYFILVANSWMQHPVGYKIVDGEAQLTRRVGAAVQRVRGDRVGAHDPRRPDLRLDGDARRLVLALPARAQRRAVSPGRGAGAHRGGAGDADPAVGRQPLRRGGHERAGHEDRRLRGAVEHLRAVRLLAVPDRRASPRRTRTRASRSRSRACCRGWPQAPSTARCRASTSSRPRSRSSSGRATTCRAYG